jgi:hypothetical protein
MDKQRRTSLVGGLILILLGIWFLAVQLLPGLSRWLALDLSWPMFVIGAGVLLFIIGLLTGTPAMAIPAAIVGGIGLLLYWQNATNNWASWAYAWTLIPGFAGVGTIIAGLMGERPGRSMREGVGMIITSLVLFAIFGAFLGGPNLLGQYWPVLIILAGIWLLIQPMLRTRNS